MLSYLILPIISYLSAGTIKFLINSYQTRSLNFKSIGLGGIPSTHNTITSSMLFYILLTEGISSNFGILFAISSIIAIDSIDTRNKIGKQAMILKRIFPDNNDVQTLRERTGHNFFEILAGYFIGLLLAIICYYIF